MAKPHDLRPLERRVLAWKSAGEDDVQIGRRFKRSPEFIARVTELAQLAGRRAESDASTSGLRPLERRVLALTEQGVPCEEVARRFRRSPDHVGRVEDLARYKLQRTGNK